MISFFNRISFFSKHTDEHRALFALAVPMVLSNITVPLLGLVDTAVVGHLDHAYYLGGTNVGNMIVTFVVWLCGFLRMSSSGLTAQAYGSGSNEQSLVILMRGLALAVGLGLLLICLQVPYIQMGLWLSGGSEQVQLYASEYAYIRVWGFIPALGNLVLLGWLLGMHKSKLAMWLIIITNIVNLILDLLLVVVFDYKVAGVAFATLVAEYTGFIVGLCFVPKVLGLSAAKLGEKIAHSATKITEQIGSFFKLNRDILIRTICLEICFVFITFQGARLGDTVVAANAILMNFLMLISFGLDGIAYGVEARVGRAKGANQVKQLHIAVKVGLFWTVAFALLYSLVFYFAGDLLVGLITSIDSVIAFTKDFLPWVIALPLLACWCFLFDGIYIGLTDAKTMRNSMIIATLGCFFPTWFVLQSLGNHALWAAFSVLMVARGLTLGWHYLKHHRTSV